jgi:hypothetical protein
MYEICGFGYWSDSVRTDLSIRLSAMGPGRARSSDTVLPDTVRLLPREVSCELERLSPIISVVEETMKGSALRF